MADSSFFHIHPYVFLSFFACASRMGVARILNNIYVVVFRTETQFQMGKLPLKHGGNCS